MVTICHVKAFIDVIYHCNILHFIFESTLYPKHYVVVFNSIFNTQQPPTVIYLNEISCIQVQSISIQSIHLGCQIGSSSRLVLMRCLNTKRTTFSNLLLFCFSFFFFYIYYYYYYVGSSSSLSMLHNHQHYCY